MTYHAALMSNRSPRPDPRRRTSFVILIDQDFYSFPGADKRMQLNNWLQAHGGVHRLAWNNYIAGGSRHRPNWRSDCFGMATFVRCGDRRSDYLGIVDGSLLGQGHGPSKRDAQEVAAGIALANLLSSHETATPS